MPDSFVIVLSTLPNVSKARRISKLILQKKLAACINILGPAESLFWWQGEIDRTKEHLLLIKTKASHFSSLRSLLEKYHPYSVPEIIALPIRKGNGPYLNWLRASVG